MCVRKQEASARVPGSSVHCNPTALKYTCGVVRRLAASNLKHHFPDHLESFRNTLPWHIWPASLFLGRCGKKQSSLNLCQVDLFNGFIWKKRGTATLKGSSIGRSSCSKPSEHNGWIPAMASFESLATTFSPPSLPEPPRLASKTVILRPPLEQDVSSAVLFPTLHSYMSVPRSNSVSLIRLLVTKVNHRTQAYLGLAQYMATARNNAIWSLGMNTCCLHVLVLCRPLFHGFERVQPRPGALDFARSTHFFCSALVTFLRVQPGLLPLVGAALGWKPCFFLFRVACAIFEM